MKERETINFKTSFGTEFEIKAWLTAREEQAINNVIFSHVKFNPSMKASDARDGKGMSMAFNEVPASITIDQQKETIKQFVVSMNGSKENIVERCLDLRASEYDELIKKITEIQESQGLE